MYYIYRKTIKTVFIALLLIFTPFIIKSAEVDNSGSLSHTIEINLPPGTAGIAPDLSLEYNSNDDNGILGIGWSLNGISYIIRDSSRGINYDGSDTYAGGGGTLIKQSSGTYSYEYENFAKIERFGTSGDGPKYWLETKPDGTKYYFGAYNDSANNANIKAIDKNESVRVWTLSKVEDINGNFYTVEYMEDEGEFYPKRIIYTQGNGIKRYRVIDFEYEGRIDYSTQYTFGSAVTMKLRLTKITVNVNVPEIFSYMLTIFGDEVKRYELKYNDNINVSRLVKVEEYGANNRIIDYQSFEWEDIDYTPGWNKTNNFLFPNSQDNYVNSGDFNGDGITDIICWDNIGANTSELWYGISNITGIITWHKVSTPITAGYSKCWRFTGDFNGDGKSDICSWDYENNILYTGLSSNESQVKWSSTNGLPGIDVNNSLVVAGDVNGDGITDIICWNKTDSADNELWHGISNKTGTITWHKISPPMAGYSKCWRFTGDFNGNGKTDVCSWDYENNIIYTGLSSNEFQIKWVSTNGLPGIDVNNSLVVTGDVNGDGKTDIICWNKININTSELWYGISTGSGTITWHKVSPSMGDLSKYWLFTGDFNGDGKTDICNWDYEKNILYIGLSNGPQITWSSITGFNGLNKSYNEIIVDDFDGSGIDNIVCLNNFRPGANYTGELWNLDIRKKKNIIKKINTISGCSIGINYTPISKLSGAIDPDESKYPYISNSSPKDLVTQITVHDGRTGTYTMEYSYKNAKYYMGLLHEKEDLGFEKITERDLGTGLTNETYYEQEDNRKSFSPIYTVTKTGDGNVLELNEYIYYNETAAINTGTHFVKLKEINTKVYESGIQAFTQRQEFKYDIYGNIISVKEMSDGTETLETIIVYDKNETDWVLNRPLEITKKSNGNLIENVVYNYTGNKLSSISQNTAGDILTTTFNTDECGNIISSTDPLGNTTHMEYDNNYKTFLSKITNPMGHSVRIEYDNMGLGNVTAKIDQNGNRTENEYDDLGRPVRIINSEGDTISETLYHDELRGNANNQYMETRVYNESGYQWSKTYYDGLGRGYKKITSAGTIDNKEIILVEFAEFNSSGRISRETLPYMEGIETPQYINYYYDNAGKIIKEERPVSETETITIRTEYGVTNNGLKITKFDQKNGMSIGEYDSLGRLIRKKEPEGGEIKYKYNLQGNLTELIDSANNLTKIDYDALGRKIRINDPSAGEITYTYDRIGNLLTKTDAAANKTTYTYDKLNRLTKTEYSDSTPSVTYKYDESTNGKGRLTGVDDGISKVKYIYDTSGNIEYMKQGIDNTDFIFMMEYDRLNRLTNLTYPDGSRIEREYADAGYLKAVKSKNETYAQYSIGFENSGRNLLRTTGNGIETKIKFSRASFRQLGVESRNRNNELLEHNEYEYDVLGNITEIKDIIDSAKNQSFEYDKLGRLIKAKGQYEAENYKYNSTGNLIKTRYGELLYEDLKHPYAVTRDGNGNTYKYDKNGNMISARNREMKYDAEMRLTTVKKNGITVQKNQYDHTGHRILQERNDATLIYNISGLYEVVKSFNRADHHTKYIYGMDGDLISQVTTTNARLLSAGNYDGLYGNNKFIAAAAKILTGADKFFANPKNLQGIQYTLIIIFLCTFTYGVIYVQLKDRKKKEQTKPVFLRQTHPAWIKGVSVLLAAVLFTVTGCMQEFDPRINPDITGLPSEGTFYFHSDHLGSIKYITDIDGNKVSEVDYTPYGEQTTTGQDIFQKKYTGQTDDNKTELLYYNARYYDPQIGRFITPDSIIPDTGNSQAFNRYMYVNGNPINYNDPTGHWSAKKVVKSVGSAIKSVVSGIGKTVKNAAVKTGNKIKSAAISTKNYVSGYKQQIKQGFLTGYGLFFGGPLGAMYGYAIGSKDGFKAYWNNNKWFRITTYALATAAVIAASIFVPPLVGTAIIGNSAAFGMEVGAIGGAVIGGVYGGTDGFNKTWDWERAAKTMMKGAIIGAVIGYTMGNAYDFMLSQANQKIISGVGGTKIEYGGFSGTILNEIAVFTESSMVLYLGSIPVFVLTMRSIFTMPQDTEKLLNHHEFNFIPGLSFGF
jgi:RHS repeat-associated protein